MQARKKPSFVLSGVDIYTGQTLTIFIAIYCWPTISTFWGISLCCCCVLLKKVNNILLVLCWCKWKRAILCLCWFVHIDPYIVKHIGDNLSRIWTSLSAQFGKNKSHCPEGLIYSVKFNVNQTKIFRPSPLIVFYWILNKIVWWILPTNIDVVTMLGAFG
jgi:hypothetical protein